MAAALCSERAAIAELQPADFHCSSSAGKLIADDARRWTLAQNGVCVTLHVVGVVVLTNKRVGLKAAFLYLSLQSGLYCALLI